MIGEYFTDKNIAAVYIGPRKRHLQTYEAAKQENWPMPIQTYWLDEFPALELMQKGIDDYKRLMPDLIGELALIQQQTGIVGKSYLKILQRVTQLWIDGFEVEGVERFDEYKQRLLLAQSSLCIPRDGDVVCFTSAGFIGSFLGVIQKSDDWLALQSAWALYNASFSTVHLSPNGPLLSSFNSVEHIQKDKRTFL